jgi:hypothetical protein
MDAGFYYWQWQSSLYMTRHITQNACVMAVRRWSPCWVLGADLMITELHPAPSVHR